MKYNVDNGTGYLEPVPTLNSDREAFMKSKLADNIRRYRKENHMTQDALAERLGITLGTISKWERGTSEPDLDYLMKLAEIFRISVDSLLGFALQGNDEEDTIKRIKACVGQREFDGALRECEDALLRFPNRFRVVYGVAHAYDLIGMVLNDKELLQKAVDTYRLALELISQNTDPELNEIQLKNHISECYIQMEEYEKGVEELKRNNICGINNTEIGVQLISALKRDEEGKRYVGLAMVENFAKMIVLSGAFMSYWLHQRNPLRCIQASAWFMMYLRSLKVRQDKPAFVDKYIATYELFMAYGHYIDGRKKEADKEIEEAIRIAKEYDANPVYSFENIVFLEYDIKKKVFDDLGNAVDGLYHLIKEVEEYDNDGFCDRFRELIGNSETVEKAE